MLENRAVAFGNLTEAAMLEFPGAAPLVASASTGKTFWN